LAGVLLWIVAAVVGLVGVVLSVTLILLPIGIPLLLLARKLFAQATLLLLPRKVAHPLQELGKTSRRKGNAAKDAGADVVKKAGKAARPRKRRLRLT
jgi:hypothetical protein